MPCTVPVLRSHILNTWLLLITVQLELPREAQRPDLVCERHRVKGSHGSPSEEQSHKEIWRSRLVAVRWRKPFYILWEARMVAMSMAPLRDGKQVMWRAMIRGEWAQRHWDVKGDVCVSLRTNEGSYVAGTIFQQGQKKTEGRGIRLKGWADRIGRGLFYLIHFGLGLGDSRETLSHYNCF